MTLLPNWSNRNRYECWAPFGCSVGINPSTPQPRCEIGSLPEAAQLVCSIRIQTQAPASRHLNQKTPSSSACISQPGKQTPREEICQKTLSDLWVSWTAGLQWAQPDCLTPPRLPPWVARGVITPDLSPSVSTSFTSYCSTQASSCIPSAPPSGTALLAAEPSFPALPLEMEGLSAGGGGFPTATCLH